MSGPTPSPPDAATAAWAAMTTFVASQDRRRELADAFDFGRGSGRVAAILLLQAGPVTLRDLAAALGVDAPYATVVVDQLEARRLVGRTAHPGDHRRNLVGLTEDGRRAAASARAIIERPPDARADLPSRDLQTLGRILARLVPPV